MQKLKATLQTQAIRMIIIFGHFQKIIKYILVSSVTVTALVVVSYAGPVDYHWFDYWFAFYSFFFFMFFLLFQEFDKKYNPTWHCIVGRNFGSYVTHETKHFIYFYLGQVAILLFKSGWEVSAGCWGVRLPEPKSETHWWLMCPIH